MEASRSPGLGPLFEKHRVLVCVGSGGVGKTTTAAALALRAALQGRRVLCLTIDPAKRLANSMGLSEMTLEEQEVSPSLFRAHGLQPRGQLFAMMLDTKATFDQLVERYASSTEVRDRILGNRLYQYMSSALAGTSEYMAMEKLYAVRNDPRFDLIVLDTPPASNAVDFLSAPERMVGLVDSPAMRWFVQAFEGTGTFSFDLLGRSAAMLFRGLSRFTGGEFLAHLAEFVTDFNDLFGGFRTRSKQVASTLRSPEVAFILVTSPKPVAMTEALTLKALLSDSAMGVEGMVINGVRPYLEPPSDPKSALEQELQNTVQAVAPDIEIDVPGLLSRLREALSENNTGHRRDVAEVEWFLRQAPNRNLALVPTFPHDVHDLQVLSKLSNYLFESPAVTRPTPSRTSPPNPS